MIRFVNFIKQDKYSKYYAHILEEKHETLFEHTHLVKKYFDKLITSHNLRPIIDKLMEDLCQSYEYKNVDSAKKFLELLFMAIPEFHDIGKINPNFQFCKMKNKRFSKQKFTVVGSEHSKIGAFLFIQNFLEQANDKKFNGGEKIINIFLVFAFSFTIRNHHNSSLFYKNKYFFSEEFFDDIFSFIEIEPKLIKYPKEFQKQISNNFENFIFKNERITAPISPFPLFALLKLNFSLLTAADYYATTHFMNSWENIPDDFGVFNPDLKKKIIAKIETTRYYNRKIYKELKDYKLVFPLEKSNKNLNKLRQNLAVEIINGVRNNLDKNLFYIEAPTGGGKTNLSMLALAEFLRDDLLKKKNSITKIFYVFPFTTLITQTFKSLKETLELNNEDIVQIHSKTGFSGKKSDDDCDDFYGKDKLNIIDYQFVNYPISLMSHIKFFDILKSNKKAVNYLMHRLANSIVIIDELQTYPPNEWDKVIYFIINYAKYFNVKFILMSATLPKIDKLITKSILDDKIINKDNFIFLNKNKDKYFCNKNFKDRVQFDFSILNNKNFNKENKEEFLINLWLKIKEESEKYKKISEYKRVHTIVEFIFKKTASKFINKVKEENTIFDEIFILSGTILEARRKEIINKIKSDSYKDKSILLITTQVVEAGVDIDMDLGFKDSSIVDSDEQLAGRINRNVNKSNCKLFIFNYDDASVIYGKDQRFKKINGDLKDKYRDILENKKFDLLYDDVMNYKNYHNQQGDYCDTLPAYIKNIKRLSFDEINNDFKLIDDSIRTVSLFIPIDIPIQVEYSKKETNFQKLELEFLRKKQIIKETDTCVNGEKIWELYCSIIENKSNDFVINKINMIIIQGIMSNFIISMGVYSKEMQNLIKSGRCEERYGFYKINNINSVYDYNNGFKDMRFEDINCW